MSRTMQWCFVDFTMVAVHGEHAPSDEEWDAYMAETLDRLEDDLMGVLVVTDGSGPNALQRSKVTAEKRLAATPVAIVTRSVVARGMATALRWFGKEIRAFSPSELQDAFSYLSVSPHVRPGLLHIIAKMRADLLGEADWQRAKTRCGIKDSADMRHFMLTQPLAEIRERLVRGA